MENIKLSPWIQVRASEDEKRLAKELASDYETDVSTLVRALLQFANKHRPTLVQTVVLQGKALAPKTMNN